MNKDQFILTPERYQANKKFLVKEFGRFDPCLGCIYEREDKGEPEMAIMAPDHMALIEVTTEIELPTETSSVIPIGQYIVGSHIHADSMNHWQKHFLELHTLNEIYFFLIGVWNNGQLLCVDWLDKVKRVPDEKDKTLMQYLSTMDKRRNK